MKVRELRKLWQRSNIDPEFRLLLAMQYGLVWTVSKPEDQSRPAPWRASR
jgi:hypothetical protein